MCQELPAGGDGLTEARDAHIEHTTCLCATLLFDHSVRASRSRDTHSADAVADLFCVLHCLPQVLRAERAAAAAAAALGTPPLAPRPGHWAHAEDPEATLELSALQLMPPGGLDCRIGGGPHTPCRLVMGSFSSPGSIE